jgi:CheY-like chemotaxis protein
MGNKTGQTILIVDDEAIIRMFAAEVLEDAGFRVLEAGNGADALAMLADHSEVTVLMTDVKMPGHIDGLSLVRQVRQDYPTIHSFVVSGTATEQAARQAGAYGFVAKPYTAHKLTDTAKAAVPQ